MSTVIVAPSSVRVTLTGDWNADHTISEPGGSQVMRSSKRRIGSQWRVPRRRPLRDGTRLLIGFSFRGPPISNLATNARDLRLRRQGRPRRARAVDRAVQAPA